jgi:hypothetical protein
MLIYLLIYNMFRLQIRRYQVFLGKYTNGDGLQLMQYFFFLHFGRARHNNKHTLEFKQEFLEDLIVYFPGYYMDHIENNASNNSSIVACVFVVAVTIYRTVA